MGEPLIKEMLGLPEVEVTDFKQNDNDMGVCFRTKEYPPMCSAGVCHKPELVIYKSHTQTVQGLYEFGKRSALIKSVSVHK